MTILVPHYRTARRPAVSAVDVDVIEAIAGTNSTSVTVTLGATPSNGERLVALVTQIGATPDITTVPSGFTLQLASDVNRTVRLYDKTASGEASASYVWGGTSVLGVMMLRLTPCSLLPSPLANSATSVTSINLASANLNFPANCVGVGLLNLGGTGTPTNTDSYTVTSLGGTVRGWAFHRAYTTAAPSGNCAASWTNARNVDSLLGVYG